MPLIHTLGITISKRNQRAFNIKCKNIFLNTISFRNNFSIGSKYLLYNFYVWIIFYMPAEVIPIVALHMANKHDMSTAVKSGNSHKINCFITSRLTAYLLPTGDKYVMITVVLRSNFRLVGGYRIEYCSTQF